MNLFLEELRLRQTWLLTRRSKECLKYNKNKECLNILDNMLDNISKRITLIIGLTVLNQYNFSKKDIDFLIQIKKDETQFKDLYGD